MEIEVKKQEQPPYQTLVAAFKRSTATLHHHAGFIQNEYQHLSFLQRFIFFLTTYSLLPIVVLFSDEPALPVEEMDSVSDAVPNIDGAKSEIKKNIKKYFSAAALLPRLYVLPSLPLITYFSVQHLIVHACLKNTLSLRVWNYYYQRFANYLADPRYVRDVALNVRPFLSWLFAVPPAVVMMLIWRAFDGVEDSTMPFRALTKIEGLECFRFRQQINKKPGAKEKEFFYSRWFTPVALTPFLLGLPAAFSYFLYWHFSLDALFGFPSHNKQFIYIFPFIGLYLTSLSWALSALFFRSYFTLGLSYTSTEYDIEVYHDVIKVMPMKGWFADFLSYRSMHSPSQIMWKDVKSIKLSGSSDLVKLENQSRNPIFSFFLKLGESYEAMARKMDIHTNFLTIASEHRVIDIRLWEMSAKDKVELFKSIREYAPSVFLDGDVQKALIGSSVMREPKYTEIWFSVLQNHAAPHSPGELSPATSLKKGAYRVTEKLASGGQGVIYQAVDDAGKSVVLKEFILISDESLEVMIESAKDFENETKIMHMLNHPKIVKLIDMFHENGRVYIALEYVEGQSLRELVNSRGALPIEQVLDIGGQMCEILEYLHSLTPAVVHRDFTPENLIWQPNGVLKLIDFSVAQEKVKAPAAECAGKHAYTPPEQFRGEAVPQSDIYACGATMYFLATGHDPDPITTSTLPEEGVCLRDKLSEVIANATALDTDSRCPSAQWLGTMLCAISAETKLPV